SRFAPRHRSGAMTRDGQSTGGAPHHPPAGAGRGHASQTSTPRRLPEETRRVFGELSAQFNNLLTVILGGVSLARGQAGAPAQQFLRIADTAAHRAADIIKKLTAYAGYLLLAPRSVRLDEVVADFVAAELTREVAGQVTVSVQANP